ncbi:universal stress protein UspA [Koleobacter methoxysyntrophicus]
MMMHYNPKAGYRIMVCITPQPSCRRLIDRGAERAEETKGEFCAVYVNKSDYIAKDLQQHTILQELFEYAQSLGGRVAILVGKKVYTALADFAKENGVNEIIVGRSLRSAFEIRNRDDVINPLIKQVEHSNIYVDII